MSRSSKYVFYANSAWICIEINEAFASMVVYCTNVRGIDPAKLNVKGARQICIGLNECRKRQKRIEDNLDWIKMNLINHRRCFVIFFSSFLSPEQHAYCCNLKMVKWLQHASNIDEPFFPIVLP